MIWEATDSVEFIKFKRNENTAIRGYQGRMAKAAGIHDSYLTRILKREVQLTPDQAAGLCDFWGLNPEESDYFLNLTHLARAGTPRLQKLLRRRIDELRTKHQKLSSKLSASSTPSLGPLALVVYYSNWHFMAIHVALGIPELRTSENLARHLRLPRATVASALVTLKTIGLATIDSENRWHPLSKDLHVDRSEAFASTQQASWRVLTASRMHSLNDRSLHYTAVHTVSRRDFEAIRANFVEQITTARRTMMASAEDELACFCLDWYLLS